MKNSKLEKQLKKEIEKAAPSNFSRIRERCGLSQTESALQTTNGEIVVKNKTNAIFAIAIATVLFVGILIYCFAGVAQQTKPLRFEKGSIVLDINPSIEICYDETGTVTGWEGLNEDGKVLLVGVDLQGKSYRECVEIIFKRCVSMGYFCPGRENNAVLASATNFSGTKDSLMTSELKSAFIAEFSARKIRGVVIDGITDSTLTENADRYDIDVQKYALILSCLAVGCEIPENEYKEISIRELYALLMTKENEIKQERLAQLELVLSKFEKELIQTLSDQIASLVETLGVCLPLDIDETLYDEKIQELLAQATALETAKSQKERKKIIENVLCGLDDLKKISDDNTLNSMIDSAKTSISVVYDFFEKAFVQFKKLSASPEEISAIRLKKFAEYAQISESYDFSAWQKAKEKEVAAEWPALKKSWEQERELDF